MRRHVEVVVTALPVLERVGVGHEVAAHAVGVDELLHPGDLVDVVVVRGVDVLDPADRLVGDAQRLEDLVEEAVVAEEQLVDDPQEVTALGALDDPVVVGRGQRDDLADGVAVEGLGARALPLGGVVEGADADDRALTRHEARDRVHGADAAGVGQADRRALEVLDGQLVVPRLLDHVLVGGPEVDEVHLLGRLDRGHDEGAGAVVLLQVDREAEVDVRGLEQRGAAVLLGEAVVHRRHEGEGLDHRVADDVGEADLAAARAGEVVVDDDAVVDEQLGRHGAHARRGGHRRARSPCWRRRAGGRRAAG